MPKATKIKVETICSYERESILSAVERTDTN
ncbi:MerR family transcriptional regulator (fragment) [Sphingorhabdus sp. 109]